VQDPQAPLIANRLTEDRHVSVLLIEAGRHSRAFALRIPLAFVFAHRQPRFSWRYLSEPEPGLGGRAARYLSRSGAGRVLSGQRLIYTRGHRTDYDLWRDSGLHGWGYRDVLLVLPQTGNELAGCERVPRSRWTDRCNAGR